MFVVHTNAPIKFAESFIRTIYKIIYHNKFTKCRKLQKV